MEEILEKLKDNLKRQTLLYENLRTLAVQKQKALILNKIPEIDAVTKEEEKLILDARVLEEERAEWAEQVARMMGKPAENLTLSELTEHFPELEEVRQPLEQTIIQLKDTHDLNTRLLEQAVKIVNLTVDLLTQTEEPTYGKPGDDGAVQKQSFIVDRSV